MKILVFAFQLSPYKGSECAVAWDYITSMSKSHEIHVIYGSCEGFHDIGNTEAVEDYTKKHRLDNIIFIPFKPSFKTKNWKYNVFETYMFYREYKRYHKEVFTFVQTYLQNVDIDIIHYLGPIGYHEPGYLWGLDKPYIWGPIGGFSNIKFKLLPASFSMLGALNLIVKAILNIIQCYTSIRLRKAINKSTIVMASTTENRRKILAISKNANVGYLPENCIKSFFPLNEDKFLTSVIRLIWIGRTDSQKGLPILLDALALVKARLGDIPLQVDVVGYGPLQSKMVDYVKKNHISEYIVWHGQVERQEVYRLMNNAHLNVITSLNEGNPTIIWEAMSVGVPTMSLDHCGMHDTINENNGIKVPVMDYKSTVSRFARELTDIITNPIKLKELAQGVLDSREEHSWEKRSAKFEDLYQIAIKRIQSL